MRPNVSDRLVLAVFALLAVSSLGLKAAAGSPRDGLMDVPTQALERQFATRLIAQHFSVRVHPHTHQSALVEGVSGACRIGVRDARDGAATETIFASDAARIGPVRYLYRGRSYTSPPTFAMRAGRLETELLSRLGLSPNAPVPVALAASPACGPGNFGFDDMRIAT